MVKKFFISMLGAMAGFWLSLIVFVIASIMVVAAVVGSTQSDSAGVPKNGILYIDFTGEIPERESNFTIQEILSGAVSSESLCDITNSIRQAANDKKIKGIYIDCKDASLGMASRSEIEEALAFFKESGKWIVAYSDNFSQGDYFMASVADDLYLNPIGMLDVHGLTSVNIFFKNLLDKIGVEMQVVKVGDYKSAVEPYIRTNMSPASKLQTSVFLDNIWDYVTDKIAANRGIAKENVNQWADSLCFSWPAEKYLAARAVTGLKYRSEVEDLLRERVKVKDDEELPFITPSEYIENIDLKNMSASKDGHIAVLYAVGDIVDSGKEGIVGPNMVEEILKLSKEKDVKGMVLRVNSGGGSAFASEQIWHALQDFKATGKPLYVSMGDYAASGGYYISCGADKIYADVATLTGSIGIFGLIPNAEDLLTKKIGVNFETVETNPSSSLPVVYAPMAPNLREAMQSYVERGYETFVSRVAEGRKISVDSVKAIGGGRVWDGASALKIGLVDQLGSLDMAITDMAESLSIKKSQVVNYPELENPLLNKLLRQADLNIVAPNTTGYEYAKYIDAYNEINSMYPIQARMPAIIIK